jgi:hypothetical protein
MRLIDGAEAAGSRQAEGTRTQRGGRTKRAGTSEGRPAEGAETQRGRYVNCVNVTPSYLTGVPAALKELFNSFGLVNVAQFNSGSRELASRCSENTRVEVLKTIQDWIQSDESNFPHIFWLNGLAGTGKSTIAQTVAERAFREGILGASFFCSRNTADQSNASLVFPSIAYQLAERHRPFKSQLARVLQSKNGLGSLSLQTQLQELILEPLGTATDIPSPVVIVIDALDECRNREAVLRIISSLAQDIHDLSIVVRIFMTSRPEVDIGSEFHSRVVRDNTQAFILHEIPSSTIRCDIQRFLTTEADQNDINFEDFGGIDRRFLQKWTQRRDRNLV